MKQDLLTEIIAQKKHVFIVSPHFDDAALSCGTLLSQLAGKTRVTIINVFTKAHPAPHTLSAKQALKYAGFSDAEKLYEARKKEDQEALLGLGTIINLDIEEALFRKHKTKNILTKLLPEFSHVYPTYRWHVTGKISQNDYAFAKIAATLQKIIHKDAIVLAPYGLGNHVDHQLVHKVCEKLYSNCIFYSDFPYNVRLGTYGQPNPAQKVYEIHPDVKQKAKMIQLYRTQFLGLFPGGHMPEHKEVFFVKK